MLVVVEDMDAAVDGLCCKHVRFLGHEACAVNLPFVVDLNYCVELLAELLLLVIFLVLCIHQLFLDRQLNLPDDQVILLPVRGVRTKQESLH